MTEVNRSQRAARDLGQMAMMFVVIKGNGVGIIAGWSWFWVLSPIWIGIIALVAIPELLLAWQERRR